MDPCIEPQESACRFLILRRSGALEYYDSEKAWRAGADPKGSAVVLPSAQVKLVMVHRLGFTVVNPAGKGVVKELRFQGESVTEEEKWMKAFAFVCHAHCGPPAEEGQWEPPPPDAVVRTGPLMKWPFTRSFGRPKVRYIKLSVWSEQGQTLVSFICSPYRQVLSASELGRPVLLR
jgi:hypothetical protein